VLVEDGNEVFPGLRSDEIPVGILECSAGRAAYACVRETYMLPAAYEAGCGRVKSQLQHRSALRSGMAFARVREHIYVAAGKGPGVLACSPAILSERK
jgi:hypothetical protein